MSNTTTMTAAPETATVRFEVGQAYQCRSACDWDSISTYTVLSRTAKRMTISGGGAGIQVRGIYTYERDGIHAERCKPNGTYSMCAIICADHPNA